MSDDDVDNVLPFPEGGVDPAAIALGPALEALLFAAGEPVKVPDLASALEADNHRVRTGLAALSRELRDQERGIELVQVGGGWQLRTHPRFGAVVRQLRGTRPLKLSKAALEVLSVIAYQQPVTRSDVEDLRGVDCGGVIRSLIDKGLVRVSGRRDEPGRPLEYRTTSGFLELFGLPGLKDLPTLREREELDDG